MGSLPVPRFQQLIVDIKKILGPSSGITSEDVDPKILQNLMQDYTSDESEWRDYAFPDPSRTYTRNLVDEGNGKSNLVRFQETIQKHGPVAWMLTGVIAGSRMEPGPPK